MFEEEIKQLELKMKQLEVDMKLAIHEERMGDFKLISDEYDVLDEKVEDLEFDSSRLYYKGLKKMTKEEIKDYETYHGYMW